MVSRRTHYSNQRRHSQREFGVAKPRLLPRDEGTAWQGSYVASLQGVTEEFNADSPVAAELGHTSEERVLRLRELSKLGVLHMRAHRVDGVFIEYRWRVM
jgi:hypothetical protein